jgi:hypothetical protein
LKNPSSVNLLEQACELLELANSAVNDRSISTQTYKLKTRVTAFINVVSIGGDFGDVQKCFQEVLNNCALLEDMCSGDQNSYKEQDRDTSNVMGILSSPSISTQNKKSSVLQRQSPQRQNELDSDALHCLQRQILGLDDEIDRVVILMRIIHMIYLFSNENTTHTCTHTTRRYDRAVLLFTVILHCISFSLLSSHSS